MLLGPDLVAVGSASFSMAPYVLIMAPNLAISASGRPFCTSAVDIWRNSAYFPASTRSNAFLASTVGSWTGWAASSMESSGKMRNARIGMTLLSYSGAGREFAPSCRRVGEAQPALPSADPAACALTLRSRLGLDFRLIGPGVY